MLLHVGMNSYSQLFLFFLFVLDFEFYLTPFVIVPILSSRRHLVDRTPSSVLIVSTHILSISARCSFFFVLARRSPSTISCCLLSSIVRPRLHSSLLMSSCSSSFSLLRRSFVSSIAILPSLLVFLRQSLLVGRTSTFGPIFSYLLFSCSSYSLFSSISSHWSSFVVIVPFRRLTLLILPNRTIVYFSSGVSCLTRHKV